MFVSTLFCGSNMLNGAFITKTTSGELRFRNRKSTRDDLLLTYVGVCFPKNLVVMAAGFVATVSKVHGGSLLSFKAKTLANALTLTQTVSPIQVKGYSKTADNL